MLITRLQLTEPLDFHRLVVAGFSLISRCTHRAHSAFHFGETLKNARFITGNSNSIGNLTFHLVFFPFSLLRFPLVS